MNKFKTFRFDALTIERLNKLKIEHGLSYTEAIKRGLFLIDQHLSSTDNEIGREYQKSLIKKKEGNS